MRLRNVDIYVTGSNSKMLTKGVLPAFRGRGDKVKVYPLSFKEYYSSVGEINPTLMKNMLCMTECRLF